MRYFDEGLSDEDIVTLIKTCKDNLIINFYKNILFERYRMRIEIAVRAFLKGCFFHNVAIYQEIISSVFLAFNRSIFSYDEKMEASFKTYISSTTKNVILRTYLTDFAVREKNQGNISLDEYDEGSGLYYGEMIGEYDYEIYGCLFSSEAKGVIDYYDLEDFDEDFITVDNIAEMLEEILGDIDIVRQEIVNLRRRILYSKNKKVK